MSADAPGPGVIDPFALLGVGPDTTPEQARAAFRGLALLAHPDKGGSAGDMRVLLTAYRYVDQQLREAAARSTTFEALQAGYDAFCAAQVAAEDLRSDWLCELLRGGGCDRDRDGGPAAGPEGDGDGGGRGRFDVAAFNAAFERLGGGAVGEGGEGQREGEAPQHPPPVEGGPSHPEEPAPSAAGQQQLGMILGMSSASADVVRHEDLDRLCQLRRGYGRFMAKSEYARGSGTVAPPTYEPVPPAAPPPAAPSPAEAAPATQQPQQQQQQQEEQHEGPPPLQDLPLEGCGGHVAGKTLAVSASHATATSLATASPHVGGGGALARSVAGADYAEAYGPPEPPPAPPEAAAQDGRTLEDMLDLELARRRDDAQRFAPTE